MMMILNQNKDEIINVDNIININVCGEDEEYTISAGAIVGVDDNYREIGFYKTKERADEVLQEIFEKMKTTGFDFTYEMPKE